MNTLGDFIARALGAMISFCFIIVLTAVLIGYPIKWMWNYLMPELFNLPTIHFGQALVLYILCATLFKASTNGKDSK